MFNAFKIARIMMRIMIECNVQINEYGPQAIMYQMVTHRLVMETFPGAIWSHWPNMMLQQNQTQPRKNMRRIGKMATSDIMIIARRVTNIYHRSFKRQWISWAHTVVTKINNAIEKDYIEDTLSTEYNPNVLTNCLILFTACVKRM